MIGSKWIGFGGSNKLPYDAEVEYLESTGTQWIDTGITSGTHGIRVTGDVLFTSITYWDGHNAVFGSLGDANGMSQLLTLDHTNWQTRWCRTGSPQYVRTGTVSENTRYQIDVSLVSGNVYLDVNGSRLYSSDVSFANSSTPEPIYLNALWYNTSPGVFPTGSGKLGFNRYYGAWKFYDASGNLLRDFIPVRVGGVGYMYDRVSKQLFGNQGTGDFIVGPDVVEVEYLRNTGLTQYIDTGIIGGAGLRVQTTIKPLELVNDRWAIGSYDANARIYVAYQYKFGSGGGYWGGGYGDYFQGTENTAFQNNITQTLDVEFTSTEQILKIDGVEKARWAKSGFTGTVASPLWLFGRSGTSSINSFHCEIGATKIWMNDVLVRDFIPVRVGMEGAMMDRLTRKIYRNAGTGAFKYGPDKNWKNPYVTNGLVAMFDGEWNIGGGWHGDSSRTITNIVTGENFSLDNSSQPSNVEAGDNYIQVTAPTTLLAESLKLSLNSPIQKTFEIVWENIVQSSNNNWNFAGWGDCGIVMQLNYNKFTYLCRNETTKRRSIYDTRGNLPTRVISSAAVVTLGVGDERRTYFNGSEVFFNDINYTSVISEIIYNIFSFGASNGSQIKIYSQRAYNRALTAEEIARNYAIDKKRFNLT